ncbi:hypothetical protein FO519_003077 [Halicephalobus sp. NKZ332]|nr:hypothetical protein FO519_003077 [Halicephalobus sp. NKZ332]
MHKKPIEDQLSAFEATIKDFDNAGKSAALEILVDCDLDVDRACSLLDLELAPCQLSIFDTDLTDLLKSLPALTVDERKRKITGIVASRFPESNKSSRQIDSHGKTLSKWKQDKLQELMEEIEPEKQAGVQELFQNANSDISSLRKILNFPPLDPDDVDPGSPENEALVEFKAILNKQRPQNEHQEALVMLRDNKYNVQVTCDQIGLQRFRSNPRKRGKQIAFVPKYSRNEVDCPVWPDHENMIKADYDVQILDHPRIIDLHYFTLQEASESVDRFINYHKKLITPEVIITTGRGTNSAGRKTIKTQTIKQLKDKNVKFEVNSRNPGQLRVTFF